MTSSRNANFFTRSAMDQRTSFGPNFSTPPQVNNCLQFYMSPLKAIYVVPPPSLLLNAPMLMQANLPIWHSIKDRPWDPVWCQRPGVGHGGDDIFQIENRLPENGIGEANIWKQHQKADCKEIYAPLKRIENYPLEEPVNLSSKNAKTVRTVAVSKVTASQRILKVGWLQSPLYFHM